MGVTRCDKPKLIRVLNTLCLQRQTIAQGLTDITALFFTMQTGADTELINFKIGPLIIGRQQRMRVGSPFDLRNLDNRFIAHTLVGIGVIHGVARPIHQLEHLAIGTIGVMGDSQTFNTLFPERIHPVPEALRVLGVQTRKRHSRQFVGAAKHNVAVQIADIVSRGGVFVSHKCSEAARVVVLLGRIDDVCPGAAGYPNGHLFRNRA